MCDQTPIMPRKSRKEEGGLWIHQGRGWVAVDVGVGWVKKTTESDRKRLRKYQNKHART